MLRTIAKVEMERKPPFPRGTSGPRQVTLRILTGRTQSNSARHPEEPGFKPGVPVVGLTSLQDSEPRLLHEVVNSIASA